MHYTIGVIHGQVQDISYSHLYIVGLISSFFQIVLTQDIGQWLLNTDWGMLHAGSDVFLVWAWVFSEKLYSFSKLLSCPTNPFDEVYEL